MENSHSDAFVFFGATVDLAHKEDGRTRLWCTNSGKNTSQHSLRSMRREEIIF